MNSRFIRVALLLYPSRWRRRYGGELEQLLLDTAESVSPLESSKLLADVLASGLAERFQRYGTGVRVAVVVCLCAVSGVLVDVTTTDRIDRPSMSPVTTGSFDVTPSTVLGTNVALRPWFSAPVSDALTHSRRIRVNLAVGTSRVVSFSGEPVAVALNPSSDTIVSIEPANYDPKSRTAGTADTRSTPTPVAPPPKPGLYRLP